MALREVMKRHNKKLYLLLAIILFIILIFCVNQIYKSRFGYFIDGPEMNYSHKKLTEVLTLNDGNILIPGSNCHANLRDYGGINDMEITETPFEIYDIEKNKFTTFKLGASIAYQPMGLLLKNNKLLLTFAYDYKDSKYSNYSLKMQSPYPYDSMAIVNLNNKKIEKIIPKKINKHNQPDFKNTSFTLLGNGKIFIIDFSNKIAEIYNPENNSSEILNIKINKGLGSKVIAKGNSKALIFGPTNLSSPSYYFEDSVEEYDDTNKTIKPVGKTLRRKYPSILAISQDEIIISGGEINTSQKTYNTVNEIEIYNTKTNKSKIIARFKEIRKYKPNANSFSGNLINNKLFLITGGVSGESPFGIIKKSSEIVDLETGKIYKGPKMKSVHAYHQMVKLKKGNILILDNNNRKTELFKIRRAHNNEY